mmetsp:Transcript_11942/g.49828  ORF Transcript_11942/g.49828 Transcript_11942/m.49828 type:complete len:95 (+) Transcript_11942:9343-9627(+)
MVLRKLEKHHNTLNDKVKIRKTYMPKKNIHPKWYEDTPVYCDGELIMRVGSTQEELHVDIWSGNHPFYTGSQKIIDTEGRVERFMRKYKMKKEE